MIARIGKSGIIIGLLASSVSFAQGPTEDVTLINSRVQSGTVCETGKSISDARDSLNSDLAGNAVTSQGKRGVKIDTDAQNNKAGIALLPVTVTALSVTVDPSKDTEYNKIICAAVKSLAP